MSSTQDPYTTDTNPYLGPMGSSIQSPFTTPNIYDLSQTSSTDSLSSSMSSHSHISTTPLSNPFPSQVPLPGATSNQVNQSNYANSILNNINNSNPSTASPGFALPIMQTNPMMYGAYPPMGYYYYPYQDLSNLASSIQLPQPPSTQSSPRGQGRRYNRRQSKAGLNFNFNLDSGYSGGIPTTINPLALSTSSSNASSANVSPLLTGHEMTTNNNSPAFSAASLPYSGLPLPPMESLPTINVLNNPYATLGFSHNQNQRNNQNANINPLNDNRYITNYKTEICRTHYLTGTCDYGEACQFAHGVEELRGKEFDTKYKTELCKRYHVLGKDGCKFSNRCKFIHDEYRIKAGDFEYWLVSPSDYIVRVEKVDQEDHSRRILLDGLTFNPPHGPVSPLSQSPEPEVRGGSNTGSSSQKSNKQRKQIHLDYDKTEILNDLTKGIECLGGDKEEEEHLDHPVRVDVPAPTEIPPPPCSPLTEPGAETKPESEEHKSAPSL